LYEIYKNCSGPGGLNLAEFLADKMGVKQGDKILDVGTSNGYQTCFLAKEFSPFIVGIDSWVILSKN
jgi:cyclopropane fatty-acyl-phospholipid synthase-like methyltransferase